MKKIIIFSILIIIFVFSFNTKVKANTSFGATKSEIENKLNKQNGIIIESNDFACFFKSENSNNYIAIKFTKSDNGFKIANITHLFAPLFKSNPTIIIDSSVQYDEFDKFEYGATSKESLLNFCNSHIIKFNGESMMYIDDLTDENNVSHEGNIYRYDEELFTIETQKDTLKEEDKNIKKCTKNEIGEIILSWDDNWGWYFTSSQGKMICFANPEPGKNDFIQETHKEPEFKNSFPAACGNYNVAKNNGGNGFNSKCDYYLYEVKYEDNVSDNLVVDKNGGITSYYKYGDASVSYVIYNDNGSIKVGGSFGDIEVANLSEYQSSFLDGNYPKYILKLKGTSQYVFSNSIKNEDGVNIETDEVYINKDKGFPKGTGLGKENEYRTCRELFGDTFLQSLYDYVFKAIWIGVPILLIVLTSLDFAKVVFVDDKDGIQKAFRNFGKRAIVAVLIFLTPYIVILIANLTGAGTTVQSCAKTIREMGNTIE